MKKSKFLLIIFWLYLAALMTIEFFLPSIHYTAWYFPLSTILLVAIILVWVLFDAKDLNYRVPIWLKIGIVALSLIFVPVYIIKAKGWKNASFSFLKFFVLFAMLVAYSVILEMLVTQSRYLLN